jgi:hypothetical protein
MSQENKSHLGRDIHCENEIKPTKPPISTWFSYQKSRYRIDPWFSQNVIDLLGRWWTYDWYDWTEVCVYINGKNGTRPLLGRRDILWYLWWYKPPTIHLLDSEVIQVSSRGDCKSLKSHVSSVSDFRIPVADLDPYWWIKTHCIVDSCWLNLHCSWQRQQSSHFFVAHFANVDEIHIWKNKQFSVASIMVCCWNLHGECYEIHISEKSPFKLMLI